ncbi:hypothetical protein OHA91_02415 [Streptomyces erythrochromogenes]|uniref:Uncharacterized protein n=1 Tax=Streptomyces erythrochromogenes TaxID=285574 RepID=A0ABZ1Q434_9ACTN
MTKTTDGPAASASCCQDGFSRIRAGSRPGPVCAVRAALTARPVRARGYPGAQ